MFGLLMSVLLVLCMTKIMYFLRIYYKYGKVVRLVGVCIVDVLPFSMFFFGWVIVFSATF